MPSLDSSDHLRDGELVLITFDVSVPLIRIILRVIMENSGLSIQIARARARRVSLVELSTFIVVITEAV